MPSPLRGMMGTIWTFCIALVPMSGVYGSVSARRNEAVSFTPFLWTHFSLMRSLMGGWPTWNLRFLTSMKMRSLSSFHLQKMIWSDRKFWSARAPQVFKPLFWREVTWLKKIPKSMTTGTKFTPIMMGLFCANKFFQTPPFGEDLGKLLSLWWKVQPRSVRKHFASLG